MKSMDAIGIPPNGATMLQLASIMETRALEAEAEVKRLRAALESIAPQIEIKAWERGMENAAKFADESADEARALFRANANESYTTGILVSTSIAKKIRAKLKESK